MRLTALFSLLLVVAAAPASAQTCSFTNTGLDWGGINLAGGGNIDLTGTFTANCNGNPGKFVNVCPNFNDGAGGASANGNTRYMVNGASVLDYNLYSDSSRATVWGSYVWGKPPTPPTLSVHLAGGSGSASATIYGRIFSGQSGLPTGIFSSLFSGTNSQISYAYSTAGNCSAIGLTNATAAPFTAKATNLGSCSVAATNMNFGSKGVLDSNTDATSTVSVNCTSGIGYSVSLDGGTSGATDPTKRKMANAGNSQFITYGIYRDLAHSLAWGNTVGSNTAAGTGTGSAQAYTAYGRVPSQTTPSAQVYTDTITVTVSY